MAKLRTLALCLCLLLPALPALAQNQPQAQPEPAAGQGSQQAPGQGAQTRPAAQPEQAAGDASRQTPEQGARTQDLATENQVDQAASKESDLLAEWDQDLSQVEADLTSGHLEHSERSARRLTLVSIANQADQRAAGYTQKQAEIQRLLDALGPAPAEGQPAEAPEVLAERQKLESELVAVSALKGRSDLIVAKANLLLRQLDAVRIKAFAEELFQRSASLLDSSTWQAVPASVAALKASIGARLTPRNIAGEQDQTRRILLGLAALLVAIGGFPIGRRLGHWLDRKRASWPDEVPYHGRFAVAALETARRFFLPSFLLLSVLLIALAFAASSAYQGVIEPVAMALSAGAALAFFLAALGYAVIAPRMPNWGIIRLSPRSGPALYRRWLLASAFLGLVLSLRMITRDLQPDPVLLSLSNAVEALIGSLILLSLLPAHLWQRDERLAPSPDEEEEDDVSVGKALARLGEARWLRFVALICALVVLAAATLGYVALSDYVALMFMTLVAAGFLLLVFRRAIREGLHAYLFKQQRKKGAWLRLFLKTERGAGFFELFAFVLLDIVLFFVALFIILPSAGMAEDELQVWLYNSLQGFSIAGVTIKPLNIALAVLVFLFILGFTRFIQRRLRRGVLSSIQAENSVQQSITTGIGYVGVIAAILVGINVVGFDLTNLALIAGALSVGIGFGLQNIVSNFVSGLILLIERPIKVGDWVVVGANEGVVKRISVRATEIETWQRSSVLIPNSDLVSTAVTNWTHKNKLGRVDVAVRVPFSTDPKRVHDLLLEAAGDCNKVLASPAPYVYFKSFSPDGMDFDIRVYVHDIYEMVIQVTNEIRMAVVARFTEAGIDMALPQRVVHLADIDRLEVGRVGGKPSLAPVQPSETKA